jgi:hypothetical protein
MPNFDKMKKQTRGGGGPFAMKSYGKGKNPIMNLGFIKSETLKNNPDAKTMMVDGKEMPITKGGPNMKYGSPMDMYGKSPAKKYKNAAQRMAVHASKAEKK